MSRGRCRNRADTLTVTRATRSTQDMRLKGRKAQHFGMRCRESFIALWGERRVVLLYKIEYASLIVYAAYVGMSVVKNDVLRVGAEHADTAHIHAHTAVATGYAQHFYFAARICVPRMYMPLF